MKKYIIPFIALCLLSFGVVSLGPTIVKAALLYYHHNAVSGKTATSSTSYVIGGRATTTDVFSSDGLEQASYYVTLTSSTTPPTLCYQVESSNDGTFWYSNNRNLASSTVGFGGALENCFTYSTTTVASATSSNMVTGEDGLSTAIFRKIVIEDLDSAITRVLFYVRPGVAARLGIERSVKNEVINVK